MCTALQRHPRAFMPMHVDQNGYGLARNCDDKRHLALNSAELLPNICDNHQCLLLDSITIWPFVQQSTHFRKCLSSPDYKGHAKGKRSGLDPNERHGILLAACARTAKCFD